MGWSFSGNVAFTFEESPVVINADGNNVAWTCPDCGNPILFVYRQGRTGSSAAAPARCAGCEAGFFLEPPFGAHPEPPRGISEPPDPNMRIRRA